MPQKKYCETKMNDTYIINNIESYAKEIRKLAAESIKSDSKEDLDAYISINQTISLVKEKCLKITEDNQYILDEDTNEDIFESVRIRIYNVGLAKLAAKGVIECAWDNEENEMVFWTK